MIGACSTFRNEADIAEACITNLLAQGVDIILVADQSDDGTGDILKGFSEVAVYDSPSEWHDQEVWMNRLARVLGEDAGCDWVVPFDADEFWSAPGGLANYLDALNPDIGIVNATLWHHRDWEYKYAVPERLPKVCFRWRPDAVLAVGNHAVAIPGARVLPARDIGGVTIRHWQYRSFEHYCRKVRDNSARLQPWEKARGDGIHQTAFEHATDAELAALWEAHTSQEVVLDPIPFHGSHRLCS